MRMCSRRQGAAWRRRAVLAAFVVMFANVEQAHAEKDEGAIGISGGLLSPSLSSLSPTAFALTTWGLGVTGHYGLSNNIDLQAGFLFSIFSGRTGAVRLPTLSNGTTTPTGSLQFAGAYYHPEIGVRYKLWAGYDFAPYIEAQVGYLWATYHQPKASYLSGVPINEHLDDFAQGTPTLAVGVAFDYRLFNMFFLGAAVRYVQPLRDQYFQRYISAPITFSFYWL